MVKWKVDPRPGVLSNQIRPPSISHSRRLIASPSPVPPYSRVVDASTCENGLKILSRSSRNADAGIHDREMQLIGRLPGPERFDIYHDFALPRELDGVAEDVEKYLSQAQSVAHHDCRNAVVREICEVQVLLRGDAGDLVEACFDHMPDVERMRVEFEAAEFDLGEIQYLVDDGEQRIAARADRPDEIALFLGQIGKQQQAGHADDRVQRRADFMAHVREEHAFGCIRQFRRPLGVAERYGLPLLFAHIAHDCGVYARRPRAEAGDGGFRREFVAVAAPAGYFRALAHAPRRGARGAELGDVCGMRCACARRQQQFERLADRLFDRIAENALSPLVEEDDALCLIHSDDGVVRDVQDPGKLGFGHCGHACAGIVSRAAGLHRDPPEDVPCSYASRPGMVQARTVRPRSAPGGSKTR